MKCPKCEYLGFEASDRCRNCGYQFSLLHRAPGAPERHGPPAAVAAPAAPAAPSWHAGTLPLFAHEHADDEPLVRLPRAPRPPLAVRRTSAPRSRPASRGTAARPPALQFPEAPDPRPAAPAAPPSAVPAGASGTRRVAAAALDHLLLAGIDGIVIYLTLRTAALTMADWDALPIGPMAAFLALVKGAYFVVFTAVGGQTVGKMAVGLRVVADDGGALDAARVVHRTVLGALSVMTLGLAFVPAVLRPDGRALHDRMTRTRVVDAPAH